MATGADRHQGHGVCESGLAARAHVALLHRLFVLLVRFFLSEGDREEQFQLELLLALRADSISGRSLYLNGSFRCSGREPKCLHVAEGLLFEGGNLHAVCSVETILVLGATAVIVLGNGSVILLIKSIQLLCLLQYQLLLSFFLLLLLLSLVNCLLAVKAETTSVKNTERDSRF
jgi:hypothetical protein